MNGNVARDRQDDPLMKYQVRQVVDPDPEWDDPYEIGEISNGKWLYMAAGTEAQMKIYEWALNRVADGMRLSAQRWNGPPDNNPTLVIRHYDGPTDGVAS